MPVIDNTIADIKALDLSTYPSTQIRTLIQSFEKFGVISMVLHPGKTIIRARPNINGKTFSTRADLSYKPKEYNTTYQRASTPQLTMFYGGIVPENLEAGELNNARIVATLESAHLLRENLDEGEQKITFSKWIVTKDIPLIAVAYHEDFIKNSSHTKELYESYMKAVSGLPDELKNNSIAVTTFLAGEFAKRGIHADFDYMISAIFSEIAVGKGMAGIYYPSVKSDGKGFNVAIAPNVVDTSLKLLVAGECTIYKKGDQTIVDNETVCTIQDDTKPFIFLPVAPELHVGKENILKELANTSGKKKIIGLCVITTASKSLETNTSASKN